MSQWEFEPFRWFLRISFKIMEMIILWRFWLLEQKALLEKRQQQERQKLNQFRTQVGVFVGSVKYNFLSEILFVIHCICCLCNSILILLVIAAVQNTLWCFQIQKRIAEFVNDGALQKLAFQPMNQIERSIMSVQIYCIFNYHSTLFRLSRYILELSFLCYYHLMT